MKYRLWILPALVMIHIGCAYFNTFYNAQQYFKRAEKLRLEKAGEGLPLPARDAYATVIDKSQTVIAQYPASRFRQAALFLQGCSRYHRQEYRQAVAVFQQYHQEYGPPVEATARFWLSLCKWKQGQPQPALDELEQLLQDGTHQPAPIHLARAEIYLEMGQTNPAMSNLEEAAQVTRDRGERGQIYYRIANLSYDAGDFQRALEAYKQVLKNTTSKSHSREANLQIVRTYRLSGEPKKVLSTIKKLLLDEEFKSIHGQLELELVKLYQEEGQRDQARTRLESIVRDYPNTDAAAEAYFHLGDLALFQDRDLDQAREYYAQVIKESSRSLYRPTAETHQREINSYQTSQSQLETLRQRQDSLATGVAPLPPGLDRSSLAGAGSQLEKTLVKHLYNLGELEAFHFQRPESSLTYFDEIITAHPQAERTLEALFTRRFLALQLRDSTRAAELTGRILTQYPTSEYAQIVRRETRDRKTRSTAAELLISGERTWAENPRQALWYYKQILHTDSTSLEAAQAAYFLAYQYDHRFNQADSAWKYYTWLHNHHPQSQQALSSQARYQALQSLLVKGPQNTPSNRP